MDQILIIKIISALLYPLGMVFVLVVSAVVLGIVGWNRTARLLKLCSVTILLGASNPMLAKFLVQSLEQQYPQQDLTSIEQHDAILVLGGGLRIPLPPALHIQLGFGADRYWHAVRLYRAGKADKIILSGGNIYAQAGVQGEAYYAAELLQQWGVPKSIIVIETDSRTTQQSFFNTADYFRTHDIQSVLLVTSAYHMPRALSTFAHLPIKFTPASADVLIRNQSVPAVFDWIPSASALLLTTRVAHEYYGMWFADLKALMTNG